MNPKVSIIVPVYNAQDYLEKCLDSILNQTLNDFEVILVNDGSKDNSPIICDEYAKKDSRIRVIHQINKGVSYARNRGLDLATGDYIGFVDPDDYIDCHMYQRLYDIILEESADISWCGYRRIYGKEQFISATTNKVNVFNHAESLVCFFERKKPFDNTFLFDKLFKKSLFKGIRLNEKLTIQEDREVLLRIFNQSNKIVYVDTPFYNYMIRDTGASRVKNLKYYHSILASMEEVYRYTANNISDYCDYALNNYIEQLFNNIVVCIKDNYSIDEYYKLRYKLVELWIKIIKNRKISGKYKIHTLLIFICPRFYMSYIKQRLIK